MGLYNCGGSGISEKQVTDIIDSQKGMAEGVASLDSNGKVPDTQLPDMDYIPTSEKGTANGVASLDGNGKVPSTQLPADKSVKPARYVVGTSTAGWTENECDYLCDGTNDEVEIQAALDALPDTGGEVLILDGAYSVKKRLVIKKNNTVLSGNGFNTVITWSGSNSETGTRALISNREIDGASLDLSGIVIKNIKLKISVSSTYCHGISLSSATSEGNSLIENVYIDCGNCTKSIGINADMNNVKIINNYICNGDNSLIFTSKNNIVISKNTLNQTTTDGMSINGDNNIISDNIVTNCTKRGILNYGTQSIITSNNCSNNGSDGIASFNKKYSKITNNILHDNKGSGIYVGSTRGDIVSNNSCINNAECGIGFSSSGTVTDIVISDNSLIGNTEYGIDMGLTDYFTITGNLFRENGSGGLYASGNYGVISNNVIIAGDATYSLRSTTSLKYSMIANNNLYGKNYSGSGTGNTFVNNKYN